MHTWQSKMGDARAFIFLISGIHAYLTNFLNQQRMAFLEKHLYTKKSKLPNAGKGLFTKVAIEKGTRICEYKGRKTDWKDVKDDEGENGYIFFINNKTVIDALKSIKTFGRYANDASGYVKVKGLKNNSEYTVEGKRCYIDAIKDIPAKSEIFVSYGKEYWQVMRENWKLEKQKQKEKEKAKKKKSKKKVSKSKK